MAFSVGARLAAVLTYLRQCHSNHPTVCLIAWAAGTFQVSIAVAVWVAWSWFGLNLTL